MSEVFKAFFSLNSHFLQSKQININKLFVKSNARIEILCKFKWRNKYNNTWMVTGKNKTICETLNYLQRLYFILESKCNKTIRIFLILIKLYVFYSVEIILHRHFHKIYSSRIQNFFFFHFSTQCSWFSKKNLI